MCYIKIYVVLFLAMRVMTMTMLCDVLVACVRVRECVSELFHYKDRNSLCLPRSVEANRNGPTGLIHELVAATRVLFQATRCDESASRRRHMRTASRSCEYACGFSKH